MSKQQLVIKGHEFEQPGVIEVEAGQTITEMLAQATNGAKLSPDLTVRIGGREVPTMLWPHIRPKRGTRIAVTRHGLAGGGSARQLVAAAVMIVVSIYAPQIGGALSKAYFGGSALAASAISSGIILASSYSEPALVKTPA